MCSEARESTRNETDRCVAMRASEEATSKTREGMALLKVCLVVLLSLVVASAAIAQGVPDQFLITPGVGIGPVRLGMHIADIAKILGTPKPAAKFRGPVLPTPEGAVVYSWPDAHLVAETDAAGFIYWVSVTDHPTAATSDGLKYGSSAGEVRTRMGDPSRSLPVDDTLRLVYDQRGVQFTIWHGKVVAIGVFAVPVKT